MPEPYSNDGQSSYAGGSLRSVIVGVLLVLVVGSLLFAGTQSPDGAARQPTTFIASPHTATRNAPQPFSPSPTRFALTSNATATPKVDGRSPTATPTTQATPTKSPTPRPTTTNTPRSLPPPRTSTPTFTSRAPTATPSPFIPTATATPEAGSLSTARPTPYARQLIVRDGEFDPKIIYVRAGELIRLTLINQGTQSHSWVLYNNGAQPIARMDVQPNQRATLEFLLPTAGTYLFKCSLPSHNETGKIVAQ
ncbi:MAG: cupredoxin domain-containing protein [Chloroflexota bacterium]